MLVGSGDLLDGANEGTNSQRAVLQRILVPNSTQYYGSVSIPFRERWHELVRRQWPWCPRDQSGPNPTLQDHEE